MYNTFSFIQEVDFIKFINEMGENEIDYLIDWDSYFKRRSE